MNKYKNHFSLKSYIFYDDVILVLSTVICLVHFYGYEIFN